MEDAWPVDDAELVKRATLEYLDARGLNPAAAILRSATLHLKEYYLPDREWPEAGASLLLPATELPKAEAFFAEVEGNLTAAMNMAMKSLHTAGQLQGRSRELIEPPSLLQSTPAISNSPPIGDDDTLWEAGHFRLFVSHAAVGKETASQLKSCIGNYYVDAFVAHEDIEPTKEWVDSIEKALWTCDAMAAVLTPDFPQSKWTDQEVGFARSRGALIVPIKRGIDPYGFIARYQALAGHGVSPQQLAIKLCEVLFTQTSTAGKMTAPVVSAFAGAHSFADAKQKMDFLERAPSFTPPQLEELMAAVRDNKQVEYATFVPERVKALVEKHR